MPLPLAFKMKNFKMKIQSENDNKKKKTLEHGSCVPALVAQQLRSCGNEVSAVRKLLSSRHRGSMGEVVARSATRLGGFGAMLATVRALERAGVGGVYLSVAAGAARKLWDSSPGRDRYTLHCVRWQLDQQHGHPAPRTCGGGACTFFTASTTTS